MLVDAIGAVLPLAVAVALSPFPVIGLVLILTGAHGRRNGPLFALGWVVGLTALAALVVLLVGGADDPDSTTSAVADWLRVLAGGGLIVLGLREWLSRPRHGEDVETPGWMDSVGEASAGRAVVLGLLLSAANPKNMVLVASAGAAIVETGVDGPDLALAVGVFVLLSSAVVLGAVVAHLVGGERAATFLAGLREFMVDHSAVMTMVILVLIGASVLGDGLSGLSH